MLKKCRRITGLFVAVVMAFLPFAPIAVQANDYKFQDDMKNILKPSPNAVYSVRGTNISDSIKQKFSNYSVTINDNTLFEVVPLGDCETGDAVVITNVNNNVITQSRFMAVDENLQYKSFTNNVNTTRDINDGDSYTETLNNSLVIQILVAFNSYDNGYLQDYFIQPKNVMMIYYDDDNMYNVTLAEIYYECNGYKYKNDANDEDHDGIIYEDMGTYVEHSIPLIKNNPNPRTYYSASRPYTDYLIAAYNYAYESHYVSYYFKINNGNLRNTWIVGML